MTPHTKAVTEVIKTFADLESRFNLRRTENVDFFPEWYENLPEINEGEKQDLDRIRERYLYHLGGGNLTEGTVTLLLGAPLLEKAGFYDPPYRIRKEAFIEIEVEGEEGENLRGRIDVLVLQDRFWVVLLESNAQQSIQSVRHFKGHWWCDFAGMNLHKAVYPSLTK